MSDNPEPFLRAVETQSHLGDRFTSMERIDALGGGGRFSLLFKARDGTTGRQVALKFFPRGLRSHQNDPYRRNCFENEEQTLGNLRGQKGIIEWVAGRSPLPLQLSLGGLPIDLPLSYYAMELARMSVGGAIAGNMWGPDQSLRAFREMCRSVQRIHKLGIAHLDLKPENFLILFDRRIKLGDFGTAHNIQDVTRPWRPEYCPPGDKLYAAPEMLAGLYVDYPRLTLCADIFALGAILFELVTGVQLGHYLLSQTERDALAPWLRMVTKSDNRLEVYRGSVQRLADAHPLPTITAFSPNAPSIIHYHIDKLYQGMTALNYERRLCKFESIFRQIDICLLLLRKEAEYRRWEEAKRRRRLGLMLRRGERVYD